MSGQCPKVRWANKAASGDVAVIFLWGPAALRLHGLFSVRSASMLRFPRGDKGLASPGASDVLSIERQTPTPSLLPLKCCGLRGPPFPLAEPFPWQVSHATQQLWG